MNDAEQAVALIDVYSDLLRIRNADDRDRELGYQIAKARAKLEALGVVVDKLEFQ